MSCLRYSPGQERLPYWCWYFLQATSYKHDRSYSLLYQLCQLSCRNQNIRWARIYQQVMPHPDLTTKNILLFGFRVIHDGISIWKNLVPNSPFSFRPTAILALPENEDNVKYLMNSLINEETALIEANGLKLSKGHANAN